MARNVQPTAVESPSSNHWAFFSPAPSNINGPEYDPLATWTAPPADESPEECALRQKAEADARKKSNLIDENISAERNQLRNEQLVKVLLVGQSESGKSTVLKREFPILV